MFHIQFIDNWHDLKERKEKGNVLIIFPAVKLHDKHLQNPSVLQQLIKCFFLPHRSLVQPWLHCTWFQVSEWCQICSKCFHIFLQPVVTWAIVFTGTQEVQKPTGIKTITWVMLVTCTWPKVTWLIGSTSVNITEGRE